METHRTEPSSYLAQIEALLRSQFGWSSATIAAQDVGQKVAQRQAACHLPDLASYWQYLQHSSLELAMLAAQLVVPETWFFRDDKPFTLLAQYVRQEWLPLQEPVLRILSLPCASGEEPYSIAMTLLDAGLSPQRFCIDAMDLSLLAIQKAQQGLYSDRAFRCRDLSFRDRYFSQQETTYQISDRVKQTVRFTQENLLRPTVLLHQPPYRIIFCRNMLIYLGVVAQQQAMQTLDRLLASDGLLFLGYAETALAQPPQFQPIREPATFACRKPSSPTAALPPAITAQLPSAETARRKAISPSARSSTSPTVATPSHWQYYGDASASPTEATPPTVCWFTLAQELANQGHLTEAVNLCETYLQQDCTNVAAQVLLGQVYQAQGRELEAEQCFQRAVFLQPKHPEALAHLALLKEQHGDTVATARLWQRVQRAFS